MADKIYEEKQNVTIIGEETEFNGVLEFSDRLIITGRFTGKINAPTGELEISKTSECDVDSIVAKSIEISGKVKGSLTASERIELFSGSSISSDLTTAKLRIANNVDFNGDVTMLEKEPEVDLFSVVSSEFKQACVIHSDVVK